MKKDISNRQDIDLLIQTFYQRLLEIPEMEVLFREVAQIDLKEHLPLIGDFWESNLFFTKVYRRNTMEKHLSLHQKSPLTAQHFQTWLQIFDQTVDELFSGTKANLAKTRAQSIAQLMQYKINQLDNGHLLA